MALVQLRSGREIDPNLDAAETAIRHAAGAAADLVLTPENTALMELDRKRVLANTAEETGNPALARFASLAKALGIWLHIGATPVQTGDGEIANRSLLYSPDGEIAARYDKIHMFDVDLPGGESYRESKSYRPGDRAVLTDLPWGSYGLTICYDLRFPAALSAVGQGRRIVHRRTICLHQANRPCPLEGLAARTRDRDRLLHFPPPPKAAAMKSAATPTAIRWSSRRGARLSPRPANRLA